MKRLQDPLISMTFGSRLNFYLESMGMLRLCWKGESGWLGPSKYTYCYCVTVNRLHTSLQYGLYFLIIKTRLFKYIENFTTKNKNFQMKNSGSFHISAQNIDCGYSLEPPRRGVSKGYPQSMFLSRNRKINVYPCKP